MSLLLFKNPAKGMDPYLWLEDIKGKRSLEWAKRESDSTLRRLGQNDQFEKLKKSIYSVFTSQDKIPSGNLRNGYVYSFWQDEKHIKGIWRRALLSDYVQEEIKWEVLLDLDELSKKEKENWVWVGEECSHKQPEICLISLSRDGKDAHVAREFNLKTKSFVEQGFRYKESKGYGHWYDEETLMIGLDFGEGSLTNSGYPRVVKKWKRGEKIEEAKTLFEGEKQDMGVWFYKLKHPSGTFNIIERSLNFYKSKYFLLEENEKIVQIPIPEDSVPYGSFDQKLIVLLRSDWKNSEGTWRKGSLVLLDKSELILGKIKGNVLFRPDEKTFFEGMSVLKDGLLLHLISNVQSKVIYHKKAGSSFEKIPLALPRGGSLNLHSLDPFSNHVSLTYENFLTPETLFLYDLGSSSQMPITKTSLTDRFNTKGLKIVQAFAKSADGTKVPYYLIGPENLIKNGQNPTLIYGYGGFEVSLLPFYSWTIGKYWLEKGGLYVVANIRGGGELGPQWHQQALKENRHKSFEDFIAVTEDLIKKGITSPKKLGIEGASNGGLLTGVMLTQRPELYEAVLCRMPLLDMLRYTKLLAGPSWIGEYGDPEDPKMRSYLKSYSPYHQITPEKQYPEALFMTSTNDDRVHPGHARKMAKKMKDLGHEVLFYEGRTGGHSGKGGLLDRAHEEALKFSYLYEKLMN
ncbi:MAG: prolyl oligopeptidase family serine peptidase [Bdellovibrionota bacterium]|nr:prolyl oligopeptidase family serine peptidase [Bdellovibrionota bacterium]